MNFFRGVLFALAVAISTSLHAQPTAVRHADYQLDAPPFNRLATPIPFRLFGVVLNNTEDYLDPTEGYNDEEPFNFGGRAELIIQAVNLDGTPYDPYTGVGQSGINDPLHGDFGGTFVFMAQNYGNIISEIFDREASYIDEDMQGPGETRPVWYDELDRLGIWRPGTALSESQLARQGDLVEIRAKVNGLEFAGRHNLNEKHSINPANDFDVIILEKNFGLPAPVSLSLSDLKNATDQYLYDATRQTGPEHYQVTLAELQNVAFVGIAPGTFLTPEGEYTLADETGRTFPLTLGRDPAFASMAVPAGPLNITGILDQQTFNPARDDGYYLLALEPSGFESVPPAGDFDRDGDVDGRDFLLWQQTFGATASPAGTGADRDFSGTVDEGDLALWQASYGVAILNANLAVVPEPASLCLLGWVCCQMAFSRMRQRSYRDA